MRRSELPTTSGRRRRIPRRGALAAVTGLAALAITLLMIGGAGASVNGAAFTTDNPAVTAPCLNGPVHSDPSVNCNIYQAKKDVWINGGPSQGQNHLTDGNYFFAVLQPGGQPDPNDGGAKNLSDISALGGMNDTCGDAYTNRTFTVTGGHVSAYTGDGTDYYGGASGDPANPDTCTGDGTTADPHSLDPTNGGPLGNLIQLWPYDTTGNPGGVYILAICSLSSGYPVDPRDCKYDAFKVRPEVCESCGEKPPAADLAISKDAAATLDREFAWAITKGVDKTHVDLDGSGTATFNYTVKVQHDPGTLTNWEATGKITILNFNDFAVSGVDVTDVIHTASPVSNGNVDANATCVVTNGTSQTVAAFDGTDPGVLQLDYSCSWTGTGPAHNTEYNTATVNWPETSADPPGDTQDLPAGSADFTLPFTFGTPNPIDNCADVSDTFNGGTANGLAHVCANNPTPPGPTNVNPNSLANFALAYLANTKLDGTTSTGYGTFKFTYSRSISFSSGTLGTCPDYTNRASFTDNSTPATSGNADKTVTVCFFGPRYTPGYWKNHLADSVSGHTYFDSTCTSTTVKNAGGSCSTNGPFAKQWITSTRWKCLGGADSCSGVVTNPGYTGFKVDTILKAAQVFSAMSCSFSGSGANQSQQAVGCLAGHLLSAKYNRNINGSDPCIDATIGAADAFLASITYSGLSGTYTGITATQRSTAIALKTTLDNYDNGAGCHT